MVAVRRTAAQRRRDRARGVNRFGQPLPRTLGTNPRAQRAGEGDQAQDAGERSRERRAQPANGRQAAAGAHPPRPADGPPQLSADGHTSTARNAPQQSGAQPQEQMQTGPHDGGLSQGDRREPYPGVAGVDGGHRMGHSDDGDQHPGSP